MTYPETIKYLESFINYEKISAYPYKESLKLERIGYFLDTIGNPQESLKCIHIAGTKGKGSTCAFISYILRQSGYKVGLYTSPHLSSFRERIRILDGSSDTLTNQSSLEFEGMISETELSWLLKKLKPKIEDYNKNSKYGELSFFEVYTSLAFLYFKEKKVDLAVLETGLGGRLDATNVVNPYVCAITPLSYEHSQKLGHTLREIATEKAGIIKAQNAKTGKAQNLFVISAPQEKEAIEVIRNKCQEVGARLYEVNRDIFYDKMLKGFNVMGIFSEYPNLEIRLLGKHQLINAAVAIGAVEALRFYNIIVGINYIRDGLYNTVWPGRCEIISRAPLIVLDGAQNLASILALKEAVKENFFAKGARLPDGQEFASGGKYKKLILVLGISDDKDIKGMCGELFSLAEEVILTKSNNPRATAPEVLAQYFEGKETHLTQNVREAKDLAKRIAKKEDLILATGSLFVVGEFRDAVKNV